MRMLFKFLIVGFLMMPLAHAEEIQKADAVLVIKSEKRLYLLQRGEPFMALPVTFGGQPKGHKQVLGDQRTPEGHYWLDYKNINSKFYKSIHVSYPNADDKAKAQELGQSPGGEIMIHGQTNGWEWAAPIVQLFSWTDGCIALTNEDMDVVWAAVDAGTPIEIRP